jgi:hypothetical protein
MTKTADKVDSDGLRANDAVTSDKPSGSESRSSIAERPPVKIDESKAVAAYANFCRVTGTPEELIVDFGLSSHPMRVSDDPITVVQRIVVNYYTAKRLLSALQLSVQRHEGAFGVLETDVQRRAASSARRAIPTLPQ